MKHFMHFFANVFGATRCGVAAFVGVFLAVAMPLQAATNVGGKAVLDADMNRTVQAGAINYTINKNMDYEKAFVTMLAADLVSYKSDLSATSKLEYINQARKQFHKKLTSGNVPMVDYDSINLMVDVVDSIPLPKGWDIPKGELLKGVKTAVGVGRKLDEQLLGSERELMGGLEQTKAHIKFIGNMDQQVQALLSRSSNPLNPTDASFIEEVTVKEFGFLPSDSASTVFTKRSDYADTERIKEVRQMMADGQITLQEIKDGAQKQQGQINGLIDSNIAIHEQIGDIEDDIDDLQHDLSEFIANQQERQAKQDALALEQKNLAAAEAEKARLERVDQLQLEAAGSGVYLLSTFAKLSGNDKLGQQISVLGNAGIQFVQALDKFNKQSVDGAGLASAVLTGNIVGIALQVFSIFSDPGPSPDQIIIDQLGDLKKQVGQLREEMHVRFDRIDKSLDEIYLAVNAGFTSINLQLAKFNGDLQATRESLFSLNSKVDRMDKDIYSFMAVGFGRDLTEAVNGTLNYYDKYQSILPYGDLDHGYIKYENKFSNWAIRNAVDALETGGLPDASSITDENILSRLNNRPLDANLNYLAYLVANKRDGSFANLGNLSLGNGTTLANPRTWSIASEGYAELANDWPAYWNTTAETNVNDMITVGQDVHNALSRIALNGGRANYRLFDVLRANYLAKAVNDPVNSLSVALKKAEKDYVTNIGGSTAADPFNQNLDLWGGYNQPTAYIPRTPSCVAWDGSSLNGLTDYTKSRVSAPFKTAEQLGLGTIEFVLGNPDWTQRREGWDASKDGGDYYFYWKVLYGKIYVPITVRFREKQDPSIVYTIATAVWTSTQEHIFWYVGGSTGGHYYTGMEPHEFVRNNWDAGENIKAQDVLANFYTGANQANGDIIRAQVSAALRAHQRAFYDSLKTQLATDTPVYKAGEQVTEAKALLEAYTASGLPRALEDNDTLRSLLYGTQGVLDREGVRGMYDRARREATDPSKDVTRVNVEAALTGRLKELEAELETALEQVDYDPAAQLHRKIELTLSRLKNLRKQPASGVSVSGQTLTKASVAIPGVTVKRENLSSGAEETVTTDSTGQFSFSNVLPGTHQLTPSRSGYGFLPMAMTFPISNSIVNGITFTGLPAPAIEGQVTDSAGDGMYKAKVAVKQAGNVVAEQETDPRGYYGFGPLPVGQYEVSVTLAEYGFLPAAKTVGLQSSTVAEVNFKALPAPSIIGRVTLASGEGVPDIAVTRTGGKNTFTTKTDTDGWYRFLLRRADLFGEYVSEVLAGQGFTGYWAGDGNTSDAVGANDGTLHNGATYTSGKVGQAFHFDGVDDYVQAPSTGLPTGNAARTLELWAKVGAFTSGEEFFAGYGNFGAGSQSYQLSAIGSDHRVFFSQWGASVIGPALEAGQWYHLAVTNQGNEVTLYVNGAAVATGTLPIDTASNSQFYIGEIAGDAYRMLRGDVDEVAVYNRALSADEIKSSFDRGNAGQPKGVTYTVTPGDTGYSFDPLSRTVAVNKTTIARADFVASPAQIGSNLVVNTLADHDDGACGISDCTLREAINHAPADATITFKSGLSGTITLGGTQLPEIAKNLTIKGPGASIITVSGNDASRVFKISSGTVLISGLTITKGFTSQYATGGYESDGGGILNLGTLTIADSTVSSNRAVSVGGGIRNDGTLTVNNCILSGNRLDGYGIGGGIFSGGTSTISNSTLSSNSAGPYGSGGGIYNGGTSTISNSTLSGNTAGVHGGGVHNRGTLTVFNSTLSGNSAGEGGGIYNHGGCTYYGNCWTDSNLNLNNSIVAGNVARSTSATSADISSAVTSGDYNLIQNTVGWSFASGGGHNLTGVDARLGALQDNGGPTQTMALLADSPAINAADSVTALTKDQRGYGRRGVSDIGAFEFDGLLPLPPVSFTTAATTPVGKTPIDGSTIYNAIPTITGVANDTAIGVAKVELSLYRPTATPEVYDYWNGSSWGAVAVKFSTTLTPAGGGTNVGWSKGSGWPTSTNLPDGTYCLAATATNRTGQVTGSATSRFIKASDTTAPSVSFTTSATTPVGTTPTGGSTIYNVMPAITGVAADAGSGVAKVEVMLYRATITAGVYEYWNGNAWGSTAVKLNTVLNPTGGGANVSWSKGSGWPSSISLPDGTYYLAATVTDRIGKSAGTNASRFVKASDTTAPSISFTTAATTPVGTTPIGGSTIYNTIPVITGVAADTGSGIAKVQLALYRLTSTAGVYEYWDGTNWGVTAVKLSTVLNPAAGGANVSWSKGSGWPTLTNLPDGSYYLAASATDRAGKTAGSNATRFVKASDTTAPSVSFTTSATTPVGTTPTGGSTIYSAMPSITGVAADTGSGIAKVEVMLYRATATAGVYEYWNGSAWGTTAVKLSTVLNPTGGGANVTWSKGSGWPTGSTNLPDGTYYLSANATDRAGNSAGSNPTRFIKASDTAAPTVSITTPGVSPNNSYSGAFTAAGTASDVGSGLAKVCLTIYRYDSSSNSTLYYNWRTGGWDNKYVQGNSDYDKVATGTGSWSQAMPALPAGSYTLVARAYDKAGNASTAASRAFKSTTSSVSGA